MYPKNTPKLSAVNVPGSNPNSSLALSLSSSVDEVVRSEIYSGICGIKPATNSGLFNNASNPSLGRH